MIVGPCARSGRNSMEAVEIELPAEAVPFALSVKVLGHDLLHKALGLMHHERPAMGQKGHNVVRPLLVHVLKQPE